MDSMARSCGPGGFNDIAGCKTLETSPARGALETWFMEGLDVALVASYGKRRPTDFLEITNTWQYADRAAALGAEYHTPQPLGIAMDYVARYLEGNCAVLEAYADREFVPSCPPPDPSAVVRGGQSSSASGAVSTVKQRVNLSDGLVFEVSLRNQYSLTTNRVESRVFAVAEIDPNTPIDYAPPGTPACVPVSDRAGKIAGCTPKEYFYPPGGRRPLDDASGDPPVYEREGSDTIVGYFVAGLGFVPNRLMDRDDELQICETYLNAARAGSATLTNACRRLLRDWGLSKQALATK
jgi:hypothetical protein